MDEVIRFDKSLQQRLDEYVEILSGYEILPTGSLQKEWGFYLDLVVDPSGWQAVWKIHRKACELLNIPFPSVVLVLVLNLDLSSLKALVKILLVQDDIHIPDKHYVPLIHLWPTAQQDQTIALNIQQTANALDNLRFFYTNLLMPWDYDEDENVDWRNEHLESRLRLYYDLKNGVISRATGEHIRALLNEAKQLQIKREELEEELSDVEVRVEDKRVEELLEVQIRLMTIKTEVDTLENPVLRKIVIKKMKEETLINTKEDERNIWVVFDEGKVEDCIEFLTKIRSQFANEIVKFCSQLHLALISGNASDVYMLNEATHIFKATGALESGGILKGISDSGNTIITSNIEEVMFDFNGNVELENLTLQANQAQYAIIVRGGTLKMNNCQLIGDGKSSIHQGIIVLAGANLELKNCKISGFATAIIGNSGANISITDSEIHNVWFGLKIYDKCIVNLSKTSIRNCKDYGVCVETETNYDNNETQAGSFDKLNIIPQMNIELIKGDNNQKGDAIINRKASIKPIKDLFDDPNFDMSICQSDEEMNVRGPEGFSDDKTGKLSPATI